MKVSNVMTKQVATCGPETRLTEAAALMWDNDCGILPVLSQSGELQGVVTDRDICIALGTRNIRPSDFSVHDLVREHPLVCRPSDDIQVALRTMREGKVRRLPVVNEQARVEGILSMDDVVLHTENGHGAKPSPISCREVVSTLKAIYSHDSSVGDKSAA